MSVFHFLEFPVNRTLHLTLAPSSLPFPPCWSAHHCVLACSKPPSGSIPPEGPGWKYFPTKLLTMCDHLFLSQHPEETLKSKVAPMIFRHLQGSDGVRKRYSPVSWAFLFCPRSSVAYMSRSFSVKVFSTSGIKI